jgi:dienelactone hydrolase
MAEVLLFHHALGLTDGIVAFADRLRGAGHVVHTPDLYEGATFPDIESGVAHADSIGFGTVIERGEAAAKSYGDDLVYAGFSLGVLPAQKLAQTRPGAQGALLYHAGVPSDTFGSWPAGVTLQMHVMADDPWGDRADMEVLAAEIHGTELHLYPGEGHLFADAGLPDHDPEAAALLLERTLEFLARLDDR